MNKVFAAVFLRFENQLVIEPQTSSLQFFGQAVVNSYHPRYLKQRAAGL